MYVYITFKVSQTCLTVSMQYYFGVFGYDKFIKPKNVFFQVFRVKLGHPGTNSNTPFLFLDKSAVL